MPSVRNITFLAGRKYLLPSVKVGGKLTYLVAKINFYFPEIILTAEFPGSNFFLSTFSMGSKQAFLVANLPLATAHFEP